MTLFRYEHRQLQNGSRAYCYDDLLWILDGEPGPELDGYHLLAGAILGDPVDPADPCEPREMALRLYSEGGETSVCHTKPPCGGPPELPLLELGDKIIALHPCAAVAYVEQTKRYEILFGSKRIPVLGSANVREQVGAWHQAALASAVSADGAPIGTVVYHLYRVALLPAGRERELDALDGMLIAVPVPPRLAQIEPIRRVG